MYFHNQICRNSTQDKSSTMTSTYIHISSPSRKLNEEKIQNLSLKNYFGNFKFSEKPTTYILKLCLRRKQINKYIYTKCDNI